MLAIKTFCLILVPPDNIYLHGDAINLIQLLFVEPAEASRDALFLGWLKQQVPLDMRSLVLEHNLLMMLASLSTQHS